VRDLQSQISRLTSLAQEGYLGLLKGARIDAQPLQNKDAEFDVYDLLHRHRTVSEKQAQAILDNFEAYDLFVAHDERRAFTRGKELCLSELLFELLCNRLINFRQATLIVDVYEAVWSSVGRERDESDGVCEVRSAIHDLNRSVAKPMKVFLQTRDGCVRWKRNDFSYCLIKKIEPSQTKAERGASGAATAATSEQ
jgi:hypothetical protein